MLGLWTNQCRALDALQLDLSELKVIFRMPVWKLDEEVMVNDWWRVHISETIEFRYVEHEQFLNALREGFTNLQYGIAVENVVVNERGGFSNVQINSGRDIVRARLVIGADGIRLIVCVHLELENSARNANCRAWSGSAKPAELKALRQGQILQAWGIGERVGITRVRDDMIYWF